MKTTRIALLGLGFHAALVCLGGCSKPTNEKVTEQGSSVASAPSTPSSVAAPPNDGAAWVGAWTGAQTAGSAAMAGGIVPTLMYDVNVTKTGSGLEAKISIDGTQTARRYIAKAVPEGTTLRLLFASYGEGDVHYEEKLAPNALLGTIRRAGDGSLRLEASALPTVIEGQPVVLTPPKPSAAAAKPSAATSTTAKKKSRIVHFKCPTPGPATDVRAGCLCPDHEIHDGLTVCGPKSFTNITVEPGGCAFECAD
jgi:hypothetical protein